MWVTEIYFFCFSNFALCVEDNLRLTHDSKNIVSLRPDPGPKIKIGHCDLYFHGSLILPRLLNII